MRLYHVTLTANRGSIRREGIDPRYSRGARRECWYCTKAKMAWAILHVMDRKGVSMDDVTVLEVLVKRKGLTRRWKGIYTSAAVCEPLFIIEEYGPRELARSTLRYVPPEQMAGG